MGNSQAVITALNNLREEQGRTFTWLARTAKMPYKRVLAQLKNRTSPLTLDVAVAASTALGVPLPALMAERTPEEVEERELEPVAAAS